MTRALLLCLASALGSFGAGNDEHLLCDTCDGAGLSLLQRAGRSKDSLDVGRFPGARIIYVEVPVSPGLALVAGPVGLLGDSTPALAGGPMLDVKDVAKLWIADFPSALIGWQGVPGASPRLDLPHHLLSLQLPLVHHGERLSHSAYALVDDDEVMLLMRMGEGVPAKLAEFELDISRLRVRRRGVEVLAAELEPGPALEAADLGHIFARADLTRLGTQVQRPGAVFLRHNTRAEITSARHLRLHNLRLSDSVFEPVRMLLGDLSKAEAWLLEADVEVSTTVTGPAGTLPNFMAATVASSGAPLTRVQPARGTLNYQNGQVLWLRQKVKPAALAQLLPPGVEAEDGPALVFVVHWQPAAIFSMWGVGRSSPAFVYSELWLVARVRYKGRSFNHPIVMLLDDDVPLMTGHDFMGCPKKMGNFTMEIPATVEQKAPVSLHVDRRGRRVLDFRAEMGEPNPRPVTGINDVANADFLWIFSQEFAREGHTPVYEFVSMTAAQTHETRELQGAQVQWGSSPQEPLAELFVEGPPVEAGYLVVDQSWGALGPGESSSPINYLGDSIAPGPYKKWWKRNFQMLYG